MLEMPTILLDAKFIRFTIFCATRRRTIRFMLAMASEMLPLSPAQYTNTRPFSTLLAGQLHEVQ
jgi:hypothetical protein